MTTKFADDPTHRSLLLDAYHSRRLVLILDGLDEAPSLKLLLQKFVCGPLIVSGTKVVVTSRPEGIDADTFRLYGYAQFRLEPYSDEQQRDILRLQLADDGERSPGRFMANLLDYMEARREFERLYDANVADPTARGQLEALTRPVQKKRQVQLIYRPGSGEHEPVASADELLQVADQAREPVLALLREAAGAVGMEMFEDEHDLKDMGMVGLLVGPTKLKARIEVKATKYADAAFPYAKVIDALRCKYICSSADQMLGVVDGLEAVEGVSIVRLKNLFSVPDEITYRRFQATVRFDIGPTLSHCIEVQIHLKDIYVFQHENMAVVRQPFLYFRDIFRKTSDSGGWVQQFNSRLEVWSGFLGVPVVMSMFIVVLSHFDFSNPRVEDLPASKAELYRCGLQMIVEQKLKCLMQSMAWVIVNQKLKYLPQPATTGPTPSVAWVIVQQKLKQREPVVSLLAAVAFANYIANEDGAVRRRFTLADVRVAAAAVADQGGGHAGLEQLERLLFDTDQEDSYRIPSLKVLEGGSSGNKDGGDVIMFQSSHLSMQEAWCAMYLEENELVRDKTFRDTATALNFFVDAVNTNLLTLFSTTLFNAIGERVAPFGELSLSGLEHQVSEPLLEHIGKFSRLTSLDLSGCSKMTDAGLVHVAKLQQLSSLNLYGCERITDAGMAHISKLLQLTSLNLRACTMITDAGMDHLSKLQQLTCLTVSDTALGSAGSFAMASLTRVKDTVAQKNALC